MRFGKIGARTLMATKWVNPYITDGLVTMWDGKWNADGGVHDSSLIAPINLVTGEQATPYNGGVVFDANSIVLTLNDLGYFTQSAPIDTGDITIDALIKARGSSDLAFLGLSTYNQKPWLKLEQYGSSAVGWGVGNAFNPVNKTGSVGDIQQKVCVVFRGEKLSMYTNGLESLNYSYTGSVGQAPIQCGRANLNKPYQKQLDGNIYRVLIYNRALTADEIAHNYEVDKARFNLP